MVKKLSREFIKRLGRRGGDEISNSGGGGISPGAIEAALAGYAKEGWVNENYLSIEFFSRLFQAHGKDANDQDIDVDPNDLDTTITSVESMFGFWTDYYISALGNGGDLGSAIYLSTLADVQLTRPSDGQALVYNATSNKWVNQTISTVTALANLTDVLLTSPQANQVMIYDSVNSKWVNSDLKTINGQSVIGTGDISISTGAGGSDYLTLQTGKTTFNFWDTINHVSIFKMQNVTSGSPSGMPYGYLFNFSWQGPNSWSGQLYNTVSDFGSEIYTRGYRADNNTWTDWKKFWGNTENRYGLVTTSHWNAIRTEPSGSSNSFWGLYVHNANMSSGNTCKVGLGKSETALNLAIIRYTHYSDGSINNRFGIDFYNLDEGFNYWANGCLGLGLGANRPSYRLEVSGTAKIITDSSSNSDIICGSIRGRAREQQSGDFIQLYERVNIGYPSGWGVSGASAPSYGLSVYGGAWLGLNGAYVGIGTTSPSYTLHVSGTIYATGSVTALSDARKKDVIGEKMIAVEQIADAPAVQFLWKDEERRKEGVQVGTLAQYWQAVLPEVVMDRGGELSMQYGVAAMVSAIVTARKVVDHERRITELERENDRLRTEIEQLRLN